MKISVSSKALFNIGVIIGCAFLAIVALRLPQELRRAINQ